MEATNQPFVHDYSNYRVYLRDLFDFHKKRNRKFTYRVFARQAGIASSGFLKEVIDGKKNLSHDSAKRFAEGFRLSKKESDYFVCLVNFTQARTETDKNQYYHQMKSLQSTSGKGKNIEAYQYEYYSEWYNSAIRELAGTKDFRPEPEWIASKLTPEITVAEARKSLERLLKLGLLRKEGDGHIVQDSPSLTVEPDISTLAIKNFNRAMISIGKDAIERFPQNEREISGATLHISNSKFNEFRNTIREFKERLINLAASDNDPAENVYQFNVQFFPLTTAKETR